MLKYNTIQIALIRLFFLPYNRLNSNGFMSLHQGGLSISYTSSWGASVATHISAKIIVWETGSRLKKKKTFSNFAKVRRDLRW